MFDFEKATRFFNKKIHDNLKKAIIGFFNYYDFELHEPSDSLTDGPKDVFLLRRKDKNNSILYADIFLGSTDCSSVINLLLIQLRFSFNDSDEYYCNNNEPCVLSSFDLKDIENFPGSERIVKFINLWKSCKLLNSDEICQKLK